MIKTMPNASGNWRTGSVKHPVKLTALLYLKEAVLKEQYEICAETISIAKEFGATPSEVRNLLEDPRRNPG